MTAGRRHQPHPHMAAGAARIVTANTISHPTNAIDIVDLLGDAAAEVLGD